MSKPLVSIYAAAIRPSLWMRLYESLLQNEDIRFEVVFVGHIPPNYALPKDFKYIYSPVKPVQCAEIAFRNTQGHFCIQAFDDLVFGPHALDCLFRQYKEVGHKWYLPCCIQYAKNVLIEKERCRFFGCILDSPILPICGFYRRDALEEVGSRDSCFIRTYADLDIAMRYYEKGGWAEFCDHAIVNELPPENTTDYSGLNHKGSQIDWPKLLSLWSISREDYKIHSRPFYCVMGDTFVVKNRIRPVEPFVEDGLLDHSQGANDDWI